MTLRKLIFALALSLGGFFLLSTDSHAQTIKLFNEKGQEIGNGRPYPLDRVGRGEVVTIQVTSPQYPLEITIRADNGYVRKFNAPCAFLHRMTISNSPSFDNATVIVKNLKANCVVQRRIPIGRKD
jgi:hypothetical protein